MKKFIACLAAAAFLMFGSLFTACSKTSPDATKTKAEKERLVPVTVTPAILKEVPIEIKTFGNVQARSSVQVKSEVDGILAKVHFRKGRNIRRGDLLFTIDPRSYQAALDQAKANLVRDRALEENALVNAARFQELFKRGLISRSDNDKARADAAALSATVRGNRAAIASASLQVERCSIRSPINGKAGDLLTHEGTLIKANDVPMVAINQIQPIEVFFSVSQAELPEIRSAMTQGILKVKAGLPQDSNPPEEGELFFIDNAIDKGTGTVRLAGIFSNDREVLWPGQYVSVTLVLGIRKDALVVPAVAIQTGQEGKFVFVVKEGDTVEVRPVMVQMTSGTEAVIEKGLQAGERVVTDGQLGLVPGARIKIKTAAGVTGKMPGGRS
ncbi:membrane fusion protein, multidrug efflux system [Syntrophus gentianae]|uniref:Membrane fusion protein, multidrug efflux system n=1 Tax=Syntrophus gentianae TaxID=43775 RepID=A0A1H7VBS2_9BACT|nr:efflux RND transporter periplasmic adaptor subunit [Syntrophus gentianae]SEM06480.1 membrane fusion protein, multidrug efflux system [Syntrophus gentianae]